MTNDSVSSWIVMYTSNVYQNRYKACYDSRGSINAMSRSVYNYRLIYQEFRAVEWKCLVIQAIGARVWLAMNNRTLFAVGFSFLQDPSCYPGVWILNPGSQFRRRPLSFSFSFSLVGSLVGASNREPPWHARKLKTQVGNFGVSEPLSHFVLNHQHVKASILPTLFLSFSDRQAPLARTRVL